MTANAFVRGGIWRNRARAGSVCEVRARRGLLDLRSGSHVVWSGDSQPRRGYARVMNCRLWPVALADVLCLMLRIIRRIGQVAGTAAAARLASHAPAASRRSAALSGLGSSRRSHTGMAIAARAPLWPSVTSRQVGEGRLDPDGDAYLEVPYRTLSRPPISVWEQTAAVARLRSRRSASGRSGTRCWTPARWTALMPSRCPGRCPGRRPPPTSRRCWMRSAPGGRARTCRSACCGTGCCSRRPTSAAPRLGGLRDVRRGPGPRPDDEHARVHGKGGTVRTVLLDDRGYVALLRLYLAGSGTRPGRCSTPASTAGAVRCPTTRRITGGRSTAPSPAPGLAFTSYVTPTPPSFNSGVSIEVVRRRLGHASAETTHVYTLPARQGRRRRNPRRPPPTGPVSELTALR